MTDEEPTPAGPTDDEQDAPAPELGSADPVPTEGEAEGSDDAPD